MGIYLNPGNEGFREVVNADIYVDKTGIIEYTNSVINTPQKYICVSRPRRFGKTTAIETLGAYYDKTGKAGELFAGYKAAGCDSFDKYANKYDVIKINMIDFVTGKTNVDEMLAEMEKYLIRDLTGQYPEVKTGAGDNLMYIMKLCHAETKTQFVILIDEWDCVLRMFPEDSAGQKSYLDYLRNWLKDKTYIALAYMTGILPVKKYGEHSALNMFEEYSMTGAHKLTEYVGFTDEEVRILCERRGRDYNAVREWYDGYVMSYSSEVIEDGGKGSAKERKMHIYSPRSVVSYMLHGELRDYWTATETYEALKKPINRNFDDLKVKVSLLMEGERIGVNTRSYQNDLTSFYSADDVFTMLIHLGYLGYDRVKEEVFIPNREIMDEFREAVRDGAEWDRIFAIIEDSHKLLEAIWARDEITVAKMMEDAHMKADNRTYNSEAGLTYALRGAMLSAEQYYTLIPEMKAGKGYADLTYIPLPDHPDKPAILVELKWNKAAESAIEQIKRQKYSEALSGYKGNIILVGVSYNRGTRNDETAFKHHECVITGA